MKTQSLFVVVVFVISVAIVAVVILRPDSTDNMPDISGNSSEDAPVVQSTSVAVTKPLSSEMDAVPARSLTTTLVEEPPNYDGMSESDDVSERELGEFVDNGYDRDDGVPIPADEEQVRARAISTRVEFDVGDVKLSKRNGYDYVRWITL